MLAPLELLIEFVRADKSHDPYAFQSGPQEYLSRKEKGGLVRTSFSWDGEALGDLKALQGRSPAPEAVSRLGERMGSLLPAVDKLLIQKALDEGRPVRLTLRAAAAELFALPWELLQLSPRGLPLYAYPGITIRYAWPETTTTRPRLEPRPEGGRILFVWSDKGGGVPAAEHLSALEEACRAGHLPFDPEEDVLPRVSCKALTGKLEQAETEGRPYTVLHVLCHGVPLTPERKAFGLAWHGSYAGGRDVVTADRLNVLLHRHTSTLRLVVLCACHGGNQGEPGSYLGSVAQALHRVGFEAVVASRFPLSQPGSLTLTKQLHGHLLGGPTSLEEAFLAAREALIREGLPTLDHAAIQLYGRPEDGWDTRPVVIRPYQGLRAFQPEQARFFLGRASECAALLKRVLEAEAGRLPPFQVLAAASGTGKSSLVLAGLVPALVRGGWRWKVVRPAEVEREVSALELSSRGEPVGTASAGPFLLVVDQFEELFTRLSSPADRSAISQKLWAFASRPGVVVLCTLRVDFLARCGEVRVEGESRRLDQVVYDERHRMFLSMMDATHMAEVIRGPAGLVGLEFQEGLVETLLEDVAGEPGALPLLEYALDRLWEQRSGWLLTHEAYTAIGGVAGALTGTADRLMAGFSEVEREQARRLFVAMVGRSEEGSLDTRRRVWVGEERPQEPEAQAVFERVVETLVASRLVVKGLEPDSGRGAWMEVAHEALIRKWRALREWVVQDWELLKQKRELEVLAEHWERSATEADGGASYLLTGSRLRRAREFQTRAVLSGRALQYLAASEEVFVRQRVAPLDDLEEQGWGVIAPVGARGDLLLALVANLIAHRERLQRRPVSVYRVQPDLGAAMSVRWREAVYLDPQVSPRDRPAYLLILGDLQEVSLELQQELSGDLMVGRLAFRRDEDYSAYAMKVLRWEQSPPTSDEARLLLLTPEDGTTATQAARDSLLSPCREAALKEQAQGRFPAAQLEQQVAPSVKQFLLEWASVPVPSVVLSASHGLGAPRAGWASLKEQQERQGALLLGRASHQDGVLSADDVWEKVLLPGGLWLMFASHSAGFHENARYAAILKQSAYWGLHVQNGSAPFIAALPQALLAAPSGPLAVVGCVDVGWASVFLSTPGERKFSRFLEFLRIVCRGSRIGTAMTGLQRDVPALTSEAIALFEQEQEASYLRSQDLNEPNSAPIDPQHRTYVQVERHALRSMILLGDPAARLPLSSRALTSGLAGN
ncbi:MAG TPA: CHAT domain-containing protein [Archangium sp.]|uniref:nSTAND1 domain-containing NTPase n=1 Tax=Archangium sp. TaxID=1872627 RepID=UPI002EDAA49D